MPWLEERFNDFDNITLFCIRRCIFMKNIRSFHFVENYYDKRPFRQAATIKIKSYFITIP